MGEAAAVLHTSHDLSGEPARRGEARRDARWGNAPRRAEKARCGENERGENERGSGPRPVAPFGHATHAEIKAS
jgi:hypothetical protein